MVLVLSDVRVYEPQIFNSGKDHCRFEHTNHEESENTVLPVVVEKPQHNTHELKYCAKKQSAVGLNMIHASNLLAEM
jgi:hypothetical protein